ncbi:leucyl aminopeptidase family protein [Thalassotalea sp. PS06]|uniref:leucyl aminopeptidase family protein n=1 Tax=Thalassotalea sp. PS06 TaxID=2594005 RepID=UPI001164177A|nr:leucyl aminopeptidase family protein [Thalassotalea sp. PS06]QDP02110.1 leucyl aminopeptidase family protein [Thalassotalea sp. PS06]
MSLINAENQGIPLHIINQKNYPTWLQAQPENVAQWLSATAYEGKGLSLIPATDGSIQGVVFATENCGEFFACGDLAKQLPAGQYLLHAEPDNKVAIAFAFLVGAYRFERYKSSGKSLPVLAVADENVVATATKLATATALVRDLINTPAGDMMPQHLSETSAQLAAEFAGEFTEIVGDDLLAENYPTIHAVGRASQHAPRLLDIRWGDKNAPKLTLVGKGVCFDSGGLDVKPAAGMRLMKKDMGGAAHVLGLARMIMAFNLNVNLRVLIPAVENAIAGNAFRPGDVITTRNGLTVEIDNTDAEGRLVLCDALDVALDDEPELIIDFATLTGAMRVALGTELPGFFATKDATAQGITEAGLNNQDPVWRMPLHQPYMSMLHSDIADISNCAAGPFGGAITAALYLQKFLPADVDWCHFDVMAYNIRPLPGRPKGGEAFGIRAVFDYLQARFS